MKLELINLTKEYVRGVKALAIDSLTFTDGVYGLLGPNGAGKSTLINILTENCQLTSGDITLEGKSIFDLGKEYRKLIGYMPQQQVVYPGFTLERFLYYMASLKGIGKKDATDQINDIIEKVNLSHVKNKKLGTFSGGMKQRALIAQALIGNPKLIILDEPTAGLDPKERIRIKNLLSSIAVDKIIIIATHIASDIEFIAKRIVLLNNGEIIKNSSVDEYIDTLNGKLYEKEVEDTDVEWYFDRYQITSILRENNKTILRFIGEEKLPYKAVRPSLDEVYMYYIKEESVIENHI